MGFIAINHYNNISILPSFSKASCAGCRFFFDRFGIVVMDVISPGL